MFKIQHTKIKQSNFIEMQDSKGSAYAKIDFNLGGSLQDLILNNQTVISSKNTLPYKESYASAILFPFTNRIQNGLYVFNKKEYQLNINEIERNNAIHGLVYDKTFKLIDSSTSNKDSQVTLRYVENEEVPGFPFKYIITISYILKENLLEVVVGVKNIDQYTFPLTLGWHPYFVSSDLAKSLVDLDCDKKIVVNDEKIPIGEENINLKEGLKIDQKKLDDCFVLNKNTICFYTPEYKMDFSFSHDKTFLQIYTPSNRKTLAIEPQTGAANCFNDNRGLKLLHPRENYEVRWKIDVNLINAHKHNE